MSWIREYDMGKMELCQERRVSFLHNSSNRLQAHNAYASSRNASLHFRHIGETTAHSYSSSQVTRCIHSHAISSHSSEWIYGIYCIISNSVLNFPGVHSRLLKHPETIGGDCSGLPQFRLICVFTVANRFQSQFNKATG